MIELLRQQLGTSMNCWIVPATLDSPEMARALAVVRRNFDNPVPPRSSVPPERLVRDFWSSGTVNSFTDLRCLCYSLEITIQPYQKCLLDDRQQIVRLFDLVQQHKTKLSKYLKCYQGLLACYLNHQLMGQDPVGWPDLQAFLANEIYAFYELNNEPFWLKILIEYVHFLNPEPCARFSMDLANGETEEFEEVCSSLGIMSESWIREEAILSQIKGTCLYPDERYKEKLSLLLELLTGNTVRLSERIILKCLASLLTRYCECSDQEEHRPLRDAAIRWIGNPWLDKTQWNVVVGHEPTRKMVDGWLKRHIIHDFFALLSEGDGTDRRRLNHWMRYADQISDLWLVLGKDARENQRAPYRKLRELAKSRIIHLERTTRRNNAFIMEINNIIVVEFGETGNASYIFKSDNLPFSLDSSYLSCDRIHLKSLQCLRHLNHVDTSYGTWEEIFDRELRPYLGRATVPPTTPVTRVTPGPVETHINRPVPTTTRTSSRPPWPSIRELKEYVDRLGCQVKDNRAKGGAVWVESTEWAMKQIPSFSDNMTRWGFTFHAGRGWWRQV